MSIFRRNKQAEQQLSPCPKCRQKVPADALDCPVCGADLRERERPLRRLGEPSVSAEARE